MLRHREKNGDSEKRWRIFLSGCRRPNPSFSARFQLKLAIIPAADHTLIEAAYVDIDHRDPYYYFRLEHDGFLSKDRALVFVLMS